MEATVYDGHTVQPFTLQDTSALSPSTPYAWIDAKSSGPNDPQIVQLLTALGFHEVVAEYTTRSYSSGTFQAFGDNMVGSTWAAGDHSIGPVLIHCIWNKACFVTIRTDGDAAVSAALNAVKQRSASLFGTPSTVPGIVMQLILDSIDRALTALGTQIAELDGAIITSSNPSQITTLQQLRAETSPLALQLPAYQDNLKVSLVDPATLPGMDAAGAQCLQTYAACVSDIVNRVGSLTSDIRSAVQDYQTEVSNKQGNRINQLTIVSIIFLPITFLTGYFGMNFQWLVNSVMTFAMWLVLGVIFPIVIVLVSMVALRRHGYAVGKPKRLVFHRRESKAPPS